MNYREIEKEGDRGVRVEEEAEGPTTVEDLKFGGNWNPWFFFWEVTRHLTQSLMRNRRRISKRPSLSKFLELRPCNFFFFFLARVRTPSVYTNERERDVTLWPFGLVM